MKIEKTWRAVRITTGETIYGMVEQHTGYVVIEKPVVFYSQPDPQNPGKLNISALHYEMACNERVFKFKDEHVLHIVDPKNDEVKGFYMQMTSQIVQATKPGLIIPGK